ncbi:MAG: protein kinase domain-containing protein, partial [Fimbriiglobus sp.]
MAVTISSTETFLDLARRSGAVDGRRLDTFLAKSGSLADDASEAAEQLVAAGLITKYQSEPLLAGKLQRFLLCGKYRILDRLGAGGMASVFLCEHNIMRRRVAIKMLPPRMANNPSMLERFHREARAIASVHHPNIVGAHDVDADGNVHFLVMEFVEGTNFHDLVRRSGPLGIERACHYIAQSAIGLQHAHDKGLVHRDIKPANLLLDRKGVVKILDLGLALVFHDVDDNLTMEHDANSILGTAEYLAPEQAIDSHNIDHRADIYSLGLTFYFVLTGQTPYGEGSTAQKLIWHQMRQPKPIREHRPEVPEEIWAVLQKMLAKSPGDRFQSAREVYQALTPWTANPIALPADAEMPKSSLPQIEGAAPTDAGFSGGESGFAPALAALPSSVDISSGAASTISSRQSPTRSGGNIAAQAVDLAPVDLTPPTVDLSPPAPKSTAPTLPAPRSAVTAAPPTPSPRARTVANTASASISTPLSNKTKVADPNSGSAAPGLPAKTRAVEPPAPPTNIPKSARDLTGPKSGKKRTKKDDASSGKNQRTMTLVGVGVVFAFLAVGGGLWAALGASTKTTALSPPNTPTTPPVTVTPTPPPVEPPKIPPPPATIPATYEAESGEYLHRMIRESPSASGTKRIGRIDGRPGQTLKFQVGAPAPGEYRLRITYAASPEVNPTSPSQTVSVNGRADETVTYALTGDWNTYATTTLNVRLRSGANTIEFKFAAGAADIDKIEILPPEPPIPAGLVKVTTNGTPTASGEANSDRAALAFDGDPSTKWAVKARSGWLGYQFPKDQSFTVRHYRLTCATDAPDRDPKSWELEGSTDGAVWEKLDSLTNQTFSSRTGVISFDITNAKAFTTYRLNIKANAGSDTTQLAELALFANPPAAPPMPPTPPPSPPTPPKPVELVV